MADLDTWDDSPGGQGPVQDTPYQGGGGDSGWGDFGSDWEDSAGSDDWGSGQDDWGDGQDEFAPQDGGAPQQQGSFIPQDDAGWGSTSGVEEQQFANPDVNDFAQSDASTEIQEFQPRRVNLSMKKVAFIILAAGILIALLFLGLDKIHFTKKQPAPSNPPVSQGNVDNQGGQTGQQGQSNTTTQPASQGNSGNQNTNVASVTLVEIPDTMTLDYNGDVFEANGKVINKLRYVQGHQVLYCINIGIAIGSSSETVSFYCSSSSYNAVKDGDIVVLTYQQVNDSYISVISISK